MGEESNERDEREVRRARALLSKRHNGRVNGRHQRGLARPGPGLLWRKRGALWRLFNFLGCTLQASLLPLRATS